MTIAYASGGPFAKQPTATYYLVTTSDVVRFYCFDEPRDTGINEWHLIDIFDRTRLLGAGDKATAKEWAKRLGLKSFTYVRI